jgi:response regulator of citrate/malate metabolism
MSHLRDLDAAADLGSSLLAVATIDHIRSSTYLPILQVDKRSSGVYRLESQQAMSSSTGQAEQLEQVSSWIHNELQCVSIGGLSQALGLSRTTAADLLQQVPRYHQQHHKDHDSQYRATYCQVATTTEDVHVPTTGGS